MNAVMRIGIAGAGLIGRKHIELIEASRDCVLAGIAVLFGQRFLGHGRS